MDMMMHGGMTVMMIVGALVWLLVVGVLVAGIWWLVRQARGTSRDPALDVLRDRYARGEITREEFEARRRDLAA